MSQVPDQYGRSYNFTGFSVNNPEAQQPGQYLDQEFDLIQASLNATINRLSEIQKDDGSLKMSDAQAKALADSSEGTMAAAAQAAVQSAAGGSHVHSINQITGLQAALDAKASTSSLTSGLAGKAASYHTHSMGEVTGLQAALDGKASLAHTHALADVIGLDAQLYGRLIGITTLIGAGQYDIPAGTKAILVELQGAGGGGGGVPATTASQCFVSSGGGGGGYVSSFIVGPSTSYAYSVGTGGNGGAAGNNAGQAGGNTTFGANLLAANGGSGGSVHTGQFPGSGFYYSNGAAGGAASGGNINIRGGSSPMTSLSVYGLMPPRGGASHLGDPGMTGFNANSVPGGGFGAGGSGVANWISQVARAGGAGANGTIRVWVFG